MDPSDSKLGSGTAKINIARRLLTHLMARLFLERDAQEYKRQVCTETEFSIVALGPATLALFCSIQLNKSNSDCVLKSISEQFLNGSRTPLIQTGNAELNKFRPSILSVLLINSSMLSNKRV